MFSSPSAPAPPPPPPAPVAPPPPVPVKKSPEDSSAIQERQRILANAKGRADTIKTSGEGVVEDPTVAKKRVMGE
jgi:hypothetical protein